MANFRYSVVTCCGCCFLKLCHCSVDGLSSKETMRVLLGCAWKPRVLLAMQTIRIWQWSLRKYIEMTATTMICPQVFATPSFLFSPTLCLSWHKPWTNQRIITDIEPTPFSRPWLSHGNRKYAKIIFLWLLDKLTSAVSCFFLLALHLMLRLAANSFGFLFVGMCVRGVEKQQQQYLVAALIIVCRYGFFHSPYPLCQ